MNLMQLKYFITVCELGTVSEAAEHLHIAQPSLSIAIKELEREFGTSLFNRTRRGMQLTDEGKQFLIMSTDIVERAERAERAMKNMGCDKRALKLGVPPMIGSLVLPAIYRDFVSKNTDIDVEIVECGAEETAKMILDGQLDMAFVSHTGAFDTDMGSVRLASVDILCGVSACNPVAQKSTVSPQDLDGMPLVMYKDGFFQSKEIKRWFSRGKTSPNVLVTTNQLSTMVKLISSNTAVGFLFRDIVERESEIAIITPDPPISLSISLVWKKNKFPSAAMKKFKDYVETSGLFFKV